VAVLAPAVGAGIGHPGMLDTINRFDVRRRRRSVFCQAIIQLAQYRYPLCVKSRRSASQAEFKDFGFPEIYDRNGVAVASWLRQEAERRPYRINDMASHR
jgi:hypothetical protein